jgi:hypothetical protein
VSALPINFVNWKQVLSYLKPLALSHFRASAKYKTSSWTLLETKKPEMSCV